MGLFGGRKKSAKMADTSTVTTVDEHLAAIKAEAAKAQAEAMMTDADAIRYGSDAYIPRDDFKSKAYYLGELVRANRMNDALMKKDPPKISKTIFYLDIKLTTLYLIGAEKEDMLPVVKTYCTRRGSLDTKLSYNEAVKLLSLGILFDMDKEDLAFIEEHMVEERYVDAVLDLLRNWVFEGRKTTDKDYYFPMNVSGEFVKEADGFMSVVHAEEDAVRTDAFVEFLDTMIERYYERRMKEYEHLAEMSGPDDYTYHGFYDWGLTAIAKLYGMEKAKLEGSRFIAIDLL